MPHIQVGAPFAICGTIDIPWHQGSDWHSLRLELVDGDGNAVRDGENGEGEPVAWDHPPYRAVIGTHVKPGSTLVWPFALNVAPGAPLKPGTLYEWRATINGEAQDGWTLPFSTMPGPLADAA